MSLKQRSMVGTRSNRWTNRPQGGGPKLSGLPNSLSSAGVQMMFGRTYRGGPPGLLANYKNKNQVFCINQLSGGVGAHGGGRPLFKMMDGTNCKGGGKDSPAPPTPAPTPPTPLPPHACKPPNCAPSVCAACCVSYIPTEEVCKACVDNMCHL